MRRSRCVLLLALGVGVLVGCNVILGFEDKELASPSSPSNDGGVDGAFGAADGSTEDAAPPLVSYSKAVVLTKEQKGPRGIALGPNDVYWTNTDGASVGKCSKGNDGNYVAPLTGTDHPGALDIVRYGATLAWLRTSDGMVVISPGSNVRNCYAGLRLTQDATNLYYVEQCASDTNLWRIPKTAADTRSVIAQSPKADPHGAVVSDGLLVYVARPTGIIRIGDPDAGTTTFVVTDSVTAALDLAIDDDAVYWLARDGSVNRLAKADAGKLPQKIATGQAGLARITLFQDEVYWTAGGQGGPVGKVMRASKRGGSTPDVLAEGQDEPFGIAVDASGVYWANHGDGTIMKLPR